MPVALSILIGVVVGVIVFYLFWSFYLRRRLVGRLEREHERALVERDATHSAEVQRLKREWSEFEKECQRREQAISESDKDLRRRESTIRGQQSALSKEKNRLNGLRRELEEQSANQERLQRTLSKQEEELKGDQESLAAEQRKLKERQQSLRDREEEVELQSLANLELEEQLEEQVQAQRTALERIAELTREQARDELASTMFEEARAKALGRAADFIEETKLNAHQEAKKIVIQSIQRLATETAIENAVTVFHLEDDGLKGKIIGREGRNIQSFEAATGVELIVDDTPDAIVISAFDPVRREVARLALHQLVQDGRIHPARIEEVVRRVQRDIESEIVEIGKRTALDLNIQSLHPELVRMVGRMKYRSSYGQNLLQHSREVANLCAIMASELGLNVKLAKRAGLLHDIGKVPEEEPELPHAILGMQMAERYNEKPDVVNAIGAHHNEIEMTTLIAPLVQICDAISGARPGARREVIEAYIKRLQEMERLAKSYRGVEKSYAIQAGRELRVIVGCDKVTDQDAQVLALDIAQKIEDEMTYPGQVKVTVIRETRAVGVAK